MLTPAAAALGFTALIIARIAMGLGEAAMFPAAPSAHKGYHPLLKKGGKHQKSRKAERQHERQALRRNMSEHYRGKASGPWRELKILTGSSAHAMGAVRAHHG